MSADFRLVLLDCPACGAPLAADEEDVVFYCTACRTGYRHEPGAPGALAPVAVSFVALPHQPVAGHLPFWLLPARVELLRREAAGGLVAGLLGLFAGGGGADAAGAVDGTFAVPAFRLPIAAAVDLAVRYTWEAPGLGELLAERLTGGLFAPADAEKLARYALIGSEAKKADTLRDLEVRIDFGPPRLLGVPWVRRGEERVDALFGLPVG